MADASLAEIVLSVLGTGGVVSVLWAWGTGKEKALLDSKDEQIKALKAQALSSETARIASEQARVIVEQDRAVLAERYKFLAAEYKDTGNALRELVRTNDVQKHGTSIAPGPRDTDDPTLRFLIETPADRDRARAIAREREPPLNPDADRREREGYRRRQGSVHDAELEDYLKGLEGLGPGTLRR